MILKYNTDADTMRNKNNNLIRALNQSPPPDSSTVELVRHIYKVIKYSRSQNGSTEKDIRKLLKNAKIVYNPSKLRKALLVGLKDGVIARPQWAIDAKVYGIYVTGEGRPYFANQTKKRIINLAHEICRAMIAIGNKNGVTLAEVKKFLFTEGSVPSPLALRQAMVFALRVGLVTRPSWAVEAGVFGKYVVLAKRSAYFADLSNHPSSPLHGTHGSVVR